MEVEVIVRKGTRIVARITSAVRREDAGDSIFYRGQYWPLQDGAIDLSGPAADMSMPESSDESAGNGAGDPRQREVIEAAPDARVLVAAGPGTGKTFVACQRVARLIDLGVPASRIWIVSFTRTAVLEIRQRIAAALNTTADVASIRIATLDSHAWALQSGFSTSAALTGSFDDNINATIAQLAADPDAADYVARLRHLIIDEGQDIVGNRAALSLALIDRTAARCGVTVFHDEAQAIYDSSEDGGRDAPAGPALAVQLIDRGFVQKALSTVHRTDCPRLRTIFTEVRNAVLDPTRRPAWRASHVRDEVIRLRHGNAGPAASLDLAVVPENSLVLLRQRADVLERSSWGAASPHRLRMSGLPPRILPWVAALFWDLTRRRIGRDEFLARWQQRISGFAASGAPDADAAWQLLVEAAGNTGTLVDLHRLRTLLGRSSPPLLFCTPEYGDAGPVLGTIHASKGREADEVRLYLPPPDDEEKDPDQETRVVFVGATRARHRLLTGTSSGRRAGRLQSRRAWKYAKYLKGKGAKVEIGRNGDLLPAGLVGSMAFATADAAGIAQAEWLANPVRDRLVGRREEALDWCHSLEADEQRLAVLSLSLKSDLWELAGELKQQQTPYLLPFLRSIGLRTMAVRPDDPVIETLHEPWRSSGFLFAPMLTGFSPFRINRA